MTKIRIFMIITTLIIVTTVGLFVSYYARGYRLNIKTLKFQPNGILVIKSEPDGASVFINGDFKTATNATISLPPGIYDIEVRKDGFFTWSKRLSIEKEIVTQATVSLFKTVPSLTPVTFNGAYNPVPSHDGTKVAYTDKEGLWTTETFNLPIGFVNSPKKITDGNLTQSEYEFSPNGKQILLNISNDTYILDSGSFTSQNDRVNVASKVNLTIQNWQKEERAKNESLSKNLPSELTEILIEKTSDIRFSPDESMIMYVASSEATINPNLIPQLPGSSTQQEERKIKKGQTYVYDIKEDRNFLVSSFASVLYWMPDSRHILYPEDGKITIMDYDGTNKQTVYSGSYLTPFAFPYRNTTKLLVLTNLGGNNQTPNLYELTIK